MLPHLRPHIFFILIFTALALVITPPLSVAKNLPTICNIFNKTTSEKPGPCGHRAVFSKVQDKGFEFEASYQGQSDLAQSDFVFVPLDGSAFFPIAAENIQFAPLRC